MIEPVHIRDYVIKPALERIGLYSKAAEQLVLGTGKVESNYTYLNQKGNGPARGLWQCEPLTCNDIWDNYLAYKPVLTAKVKSLMTAYDHVEQLRWNLQYAAAICRIHYLRVPAPLPAADDALALTNYHKRYYNTFLGKTDVEKSINDFEWAISYSKP